MIRTISLAVLAAVAFSGCVSSGYSYRGGGVGDYYYGRSSASYYGAGAPYGSVGYGYPGGLYGRIGYGYPSYYGGGYYGYGFPYSSPYYRPGYGYYGPYYPPYVHPRHRHRHGGRRPHHGKRPDPDHAGHPGPGGDEPPWRDLNRLRDGLPRDPRAIPSPPDVVVQRPPMGSVRGMPPRLERRAPPARAEAVVQPRSAPRRTSTEDRQIP